MKNGGSFHSYVKLPEGNQHFNLGCAKLSGFYAQKGDLEIAQADFSMLKLGLEM